ncbi:MAG: VOC family protein [Terrimicrobiaceae bacterium]
MAKITGFHHVAIHSSDFDRSLQFYKSVLGLVEKIAWGEHPDRAVMLHAGDNRPVEIFEKPEPAPAAAGTLLHFALRTDDCVAMLEKVRAAGMTVTMEPKEITIASTTGPVPVHIAFFVGPDGEIVELFESQLV